ncbi:MAG: copper amine oxidase N-terminal domain-containing protein, partial [Bacillota bacterium]
MDCCNSRNAPNIERILRRKENCLNEGKNDRTLVPFRAVAEMWNVKVSWDGARQTVNASDGESSVMLQIGNKTA